MIVCAQSRLLSEQLKRVLSNVSHSKIFYLIDALIVIVELSRAVLSANLL